MDEEFDPHHVWLGIPPVDQPANHYRLLGLAVLEDDPDVIRECAERQIAHVRRNSLGARQMLSQQVLNELATAKSCLLDVEAKRQYDATLPDRPLPDSANEEHRMVAGGEDAPFDPHYRWLGIRKEEQPADHYRLLGLAWLEPNSNVIRDAYDRQTEHVVRHAKQHPDEAEQLLEELETAFACLQDSSKRAEYDAQIQASMVIPATATLDDEDVVPPPVGTAAVTRPARRTRNAGQRGSASRGRTRRLLVVVAIGLVGALSAYGIIVRQRLNSATMDRLEIPDVARSDRGPSPSDAEESTASLDVVASITDEADPQPAPRRPPTIGMYAWRKGLPSVPMIQRDAGFCFLSMVAGQFLGGGERAGVRIDDGRWHLDGNGVQHIFANAISVSAKDSASQIAYYRWSRGQPAIRMIHQDEGFCVLSSVGGGFRGGAEWVRVFVDEEGYWTLAGGAQRALSAEAISFKTDLADQPVAEFFWQRGQPRVKMIHKDDGFCILSGIHGQLEGGGERAEVTLDADGYWYLDCAAAQGLWVRAIAIRYRQ
jgi:hypothetical protein